MLGGLFDVFRRAETSAAPPPSLALPAELVLAIETAEIYWRPSRADDDEAGPIVSVAGLGRWVYRTTTEAADRVGRTYPELPRRLCVRAARLIEAQIGRRNVAHHRRRALRRDPFAIDWEF